MFDTFAGLSHVHFVGIGGAGMSGIAEVLLGYEGLIVSGCDQARGEAVQRLEGLGVSAAVGHGPSTSTGSIWWSSRRPSATTTPRSRPHGRGALPWCGGPRCSPS